MNIKQVRYRHLCYAGLTLILIGFIYVFISHKEEFTINDILDYVFLVMTGFIAATRAFYLDRYLKQLDGKVLMDFWTFFNETSIKALIVLYFIVRPFTSRNQSTDIEKTRKTVNFLTFTIYIILICFITDKLIY